MAKKRRPKPKRVKALPPASKARVGEQYTITRSGRDLTYKRQYARGSNRKNRNLKFKIVKNKKAKKKRS